MTLGRCSISVGESSMGASVTSDQGWGMLVVDLPWRLEKAVAASLGDYTDTSVASINIQGMLIKMFRNLQARHGQRA